MADRTRCFLLLQDDAPWWLLTHYPEANDVFTWLDGACIVAFIVGGAVALGSAVLAAVRAAAWLAGDAKLSWQRLALALVPIAGIGIFLGLSMLTLSHLKGERMSLDWVAALRIGLLVFGTGFSAWLGWRLTVRDLSLRGLLAFAVFLLPLGLIDWLWRAVFSARMVERSWPVWRLDGVLQRSAVGCSYAGCGA